MWKFILFIIIAIIAVWQISIMSGGNTTPKNSNSNANSIEKNLTDEKKIDKSKVATSSPKELIEREEKIPSNQKVEKENSKPIKKVEEEVVKVEKEEDKKEGEIKVSSIKGAFSNLTKEKPKNETKELSNVVKKADEESKTDNYEALLTSEAVDGSSEKVANSVEGEGTGIKIATKTKKIKEKSEYEKMLLAEIDEDTPKKESKNREEANVASNTIIRDRLQKLLLSAKKAIDKESNSMLTKVDDVKTNNAVKVENKTSKELLNELVKNVVNSKSATESAYVANLLKEVSKSKIQVVEVKKDYTTIIVKAGDSLSAIAKSIYGDQKKYILIYNANKDKLKNPNLISIGTILKIPKIK